MRSPRGWAWMEKTKGLRTEPWGTPKLQVWGEEEKSAKETKTFICDIGKAREHKSYKAKEQKTKTKTNPKTLSGRRESIVGSNTADTLRGE